MIDVPVFEPVTKKEMILNHLNAYRGDKITALEISELCGTSIGFTSKTLRAAGVIKKKTDKIKATKTDRLKSLARFYALGFYSLADVARMSGTSIAYARQVVPAIAKVKRGRGLYHLVDNLINIGWGFDRAIKSVGVEADKYVRFKTEVRK